MKMPHGKNHWYLYRVPSATVLAPIFSQSYVYMVNLGLNHNTNSGTNYSWVKLHCTQGLGQQWSTKVKKYPFFHIFHIFVHFLHACYPFSKQDMLKSFLSQIPTTFIYPLLWTTSLAKWYISYWDKMFGIAHSVPIFVPSATHFFECPVWTPIEYFRVT